MKGNQQFVSCCLQFDIVIQSEVFKVKAYRLPRLRHCRTILGITTPRSGGKHQPFTTTTQHSLILLTTHNCKGQREHVNTQLVKAYLSMPKAGLATHQK